MYCLSIRVFLISEHNTSRGNPLSSPPRPAAAPGLAPVTGGQALIRQLAREGISQVCAVPGVQLDWVIDPLIDQARDLSLCVPRHEQATSYMADGYARTTGRPSVCMMVPGPGVLNAMAGLATAYACSSPVVCIAGQINSKGIGRGYGMLHEVRHQSALLASVTKWSALATKPEEVPSLVNQAIHQARSAHTRPTAVEIPPDIAQASASALSPAEPLQPVIEAPARAAIEAAAALLGAARAPLIYAGGGVLAANSSSELQALAERLDAPVVMSENGRGALSDRHPLALPALAGRALMPHADVVLVVGSRFVTLGGVPMYEPASHARHIYLHVEAADATGPREPGLVLAGDARLGLDQLRAALGPSRAAGWGTAASKKVREWCDVQLAPLEPQMSWIRALRSAIPDDGILVNELTQVGYLSTLAYPVHSPRSFITPGYQGTLGYGFPTAIGAAIGNPDRVVVSINGDGGFGWNLQELATAARYRVPVIAVVFKDNAFGNVRRIQREVFAREIGSDLHNPDFVKLAEAFGVNAARVNTPDALTGAIREATNTRDRGPLLLEVPVGEMPSPWHLINRLAKRQHAPPPNPLGLK
jgi:acetolactate synthase-1/2/3 large subunit